MLRKPTPFAALDYQTPYAPTDFGRATDASSLASRSLLIRLAAGRPEAG
jgi:hypothetical protein